MSVKAIRNLGNKKLKPLVIHLYRNNAPTTNLTPVTSWSGGDYQSKSEATSLIFKNPGYTYLKFTHGGVGGKNIQLYDANTGVMIWNYGSWEEKQIDRVINIKGHKNLYFYVSSTAHWNSTSTIILSPSSVGKVQSEVLLTNEE